MPPKSDLNKAQFEQSDFPILCECVSTNSGCANARRTCLGPNPYVRMTKQDYGSECKVCTRPFTVFRWQPGGGARYKKTEVCQTCAKVKNVCQTCLLDLQYALPTQLRDMALGRPSKAPTSDINREYFAQNMEGKIDEIQSGSGYSDVNGAGKEMLKKLARQDPYYHRNRPKLCSFFAKGECTRGDECPYRHEMPVDRGDLSKQNIKDRYHGVNDPVARKILAQNSKDSGLIAPEDEAVMSLFLTGLADGTDENQIRAALPPSLKQGDSSAGIKSIVIVGSMAFLNFLQRRSAEDAANAIVVKNGGPKLEINGQTVKVAWGRSKAKKPAPAPAAALIPA